VKTAVPKQQQDMVEECRTLQVPAGCERLRVDQALAQILPEFTRSQLQQWIHDGRVTVDGSPPRKRDRLKGGETISLQIPARAELTDRPQAMALRIVHEDDDILVIDKPAGLVVHPGAGNREHTLLNALLHHAPDLALLPRAGIVHRLDKETSGLLVVAKNEVARQSLIGQLQDRTMSREYVAIVNGVLVAGGTVEAAIGRHRTDRKRMAVTDRGKPAISHFRVLKKYRAHTLVQVRLESGRTHQIRVHMAHIHHPVVGDPVYGGRARLPKGATTSLREYLRQFRRQALHAMKLGLVHPATDERLQWSSSVPADMHELMEVLAADHRVAGEKS